MDLAKDPEIHMDAFIRIRKTWILQRTLRYKRMVGHIVGDVDVVEDPEIHMAGSSSMDFAGDPEIHMDVEF